VAGVHLLKVVLINNTAVYFFLVDRITSRAKSSIRANRYAENSAMTFGGLVDTVLQKSLNRFFDDDFWGFDGMLTSKEVPVNIRETDKAYEMVWLPRV